MLPFRYITEALVFAAAKAGLARLEVRYFHDVPGEAVYRDAALRDAQPLARAAAGFVDQGILIYGDAGAARGRRESRRAEAGKQAVDELRKEVTPTVVWLNPVPRRRWQGSSAAALVEAEVPMYPLSHEGLRAAIRALHGRAS